MSLTLATTDTITGVAGSATSITYTIFGDEVSAGADAFKVLAQGQLPAAVDTLYTVPASTMAIVKAIHLVNGTAGTVTARINVKAPPRPTPSCPPSPSWPVVSRSTPTTAGRSTTTRANSFQSARRGPRERLAPASPSRTRVRPSRPTPRRWTSSGLAWSRRGPLASRRSPSRAAYRSASPARSATRYVGGTASVAPTTGTFAVGDFVITQAGSVYICTVAGSPGTWVAVSGGGGAVATMPSGTRLVTSP